LFSGLVRTRVVHVASEGSAEPGGKVTRRDDSNTAGKNAAGLSPNTGTGVTAGQAESGLAAKAAPVIAPKTARTAATHTSSRVFNVLT
jgi:hypothetical protein